MWDYEPRGAARELLTSRASEIMISGPAGTGKSVAMLVKAHLTNAKMPGTASLLVRQTHASLTRSTLVTFEKTVAAQDLAAGKLKWFGGSGSRPACYEYTNGSRLYAGGMDQPGKFLSMDLDRVYVDEANQLSLTAVETLITRLRGKSGAVRQIILACNPDHPDHWIKKRADDGTLLHLHSKHLDNPYLFDRHGNATVDGQDYLDRLRALTGVRRMRYLDGIWAAAEGLVLDDWSEADNVIPWFDVPPEWPLFLTVDFGYSNPFVAQWWRTDPDGRMYLVREIHQTQTLVEDHARHIKAIMAEHPEEPVPYAVVCDHDAEDRATLTRHLGLPTVAAKKAVSRGIQLTQARVRKAGDGKPRMYVFRDAVIGRDDVAVAQGRPRGFAAESLGYVWETVRGTDGIPLERPVKLHDHSMDAGRYAVAHLDWHEESKLGNPARPQQNTGQPSNNSRWSTPVGR